MASRGRSLLLVDNRESGGRKEEWDTTPCKHCPRFLKVFRQPYTHLHTEECHIEGCDHEQYFCSRCDGMICRLCGRKMHQTGVCEPYRKQMEKALTNHYRGAMWSRLTGGEAAMFGPLLKMLGMRKQKLAPGHVDRCKKCGNKDLDVMLSSAGVVMSQICRLCSTRQWIDTSMIQKPTGDIDI